MTRYQINLIQNGTKRQILFQAESIAAALKIMAALGATTLVVLS